MNNDRSGFCPGAETASDRKGHLWRAETKGRTTFRRKLFVNFVQPARLISTVYGVQSTQRTMHRFCLQTNPIKHFLQLKDKREVFGRVLQCRTGHGYTGEFRQFFMPLSPDPTSCPCDNGTLGSRSYILIDFPRYEHHRKILRKASKHLALSVLLGTSKGIAALAKFIQKTAASTRTGAPHVISQINLPPLTRQRTKPDHQSTPQPHLNFRRWQMMAKNPQATTTPTFSHNLPSSALNHT